MGGWDGMDGCGQRVGIWAWGNSGGMHSWGAVEYECGEDAHPDFAERINREEG